MRVLIASKHAATGRNPIGGVQSWSRTIGAELSRLGHAVTYWGPEWSPPATIYDLGIFANLKSTRMALPRCQKVLKVSHGIIEDERGGPDFLATSEEVAQKWRCSGVIRQPIDLDFWSPGEEERVFLTRHSYRKGLDFLPSLAADLGLGFKHLTDSPQSAVRDVLRRSKVVVAAVVIADDREYQGALFDPDPVGAMTRNYSGRGGRTATRSELQLGIARAIQRGSLREHVEQHHDARRIAEQLLCLLS